MRFVHAVRAGFLNYANFRDRSTRSSYWYWALFNVIVSLATATNETANGLVSIVFLLPSIAVAVRRMHDIGRNGWWILVPLYNIYLACQPSEAGINRYGPPEPPLWLR